MEGWGGGASDGYTALRKSQPGSRGVRVPHWTETAWLWDPTMHSYCLGAAQGQQGVCMNMAVDL